MERFMIIPLLFVVSILIITMNFEKMVNWKYGNGQNVSISTESSDNTQLLLKVKKHLMKAHNSARSGKTIWEIQAAYKTLHELLQTKFNETELEGPNYDAYLTVPNKTYEVCPEKYLGQFADYPIFHKCFSTISCKHPPLESLVSIVIVTTNCSQVEVLLLGIQKYFFKFEVIVEILEKSNCGIDIEKKYASKFEKIVIKSNEGLDDTGATWRGLIEKTSKKYVFIGRGLESFDEHSSNFERLVRLIKITDVDAAGGSVRYNNGHWYMGCYQIGMRNYAIKFHEGYDMSHTSCVFCDYVSSPFVAKKEILLDNIKSHLQGEAVFTNLFIALSRNDRVSSIVCPDVMFHIMPGDRLNDLDKSLWKQIAREWQINKIILPNRKNHWFDCDAVGIKCTFTAGEIVPECCLKELNDALIYLIQMCRNHSIDIEVAGGTMLGGLKFSGYFPLERDHNVSFLGIQYPKLNDLKSEFADHGYKLEGKYLSKYGSDLEKCVTMGVVNCAYYTMKTKYWTIELWGSAYLLHNRGPEKLSTPTYMSNIGVWMRAYDNPAKSLRGQYGDNLFLHCITLSKSGSVLPCNLLDFHNLSNSNLPEGNIQFQDVWI